MTYHARLEDDAQTGAQRWLTNAKAAGVDADVLDGDFRSVGDTYASQLMNKYLSESVDSRLPSFRTPKSSLSGKSSQPRRARNGRLLSIAAPIDALFGRTMTGSSISKN